MTIENSNLKILLYPGPAFPGDGVPAMASHCIEAGNLERLGNLNLRTAALAQRSLVQKLVGRGFGSAC